MADNDLKNASGPSAGLAVFAAYQSGIVSLLATGSPRHRELATGNQPRKLPIIQATEAPRSLDEYEAEWNKWRGVGRRGWLTTIDELDAL